MNAHTRLKEIEESLKRQNYCCADCNVSEHEGLRKEQEGILLGLESGRVEMLKELKEKMYWEEGKGTDKIYYLIEENRYPHDAGCEGQMCYCMSRRKKEE